MVPPLGEFLSTYLEIHALGEGIRDGFKALNPGTLPDVPVKFNGINTLGVYVEDKDETAYYYGGQVFGWFLKALGLFILVKYGLTGTL